ncbi:MAG: 3-hydroxyacyl-CoA dehydrogenase NAD-binding domain-containing protein [Chitinophagaceae bacterium]
MNIGIIGCGTMGIGIAQIASTFLHNVVVVDKSEEALLVAKKNLVATLHKLVEKAKLTQEDATNILNRISWTQDINELATSSLIIEAIIENLEIKQSLFSSIEKVVSDECILASNTSSLSITSIAASCKKAERVLGIHFFNPAPLMQLVEIIPAIQTSEEVVQKAKQIIDSWNKKTVIAKDTPGFIVNRIARPFYSEAIRIYEEGIATIPIIDMAMKSVGFKMGPFELMDLIGHDVNYAVTESVWRAFYFDTKYTPSYTQKRLVEANWLGRKTGRGFYQYPSTTETSIEIKDELQSNIIERILVMLIHEAAHAVYMQVASAHDIEIAMTKGVNYPKGLLAWADEIGIAQCVKKLDELYHLYHEERYRCTPLLRKMADANLKFF